MATEAGDVSRPLIAGYVDSCSMSAGPIVPAIVGAGETEGAPWYWPATGEAALAGNR